MHPSNPDLMKKLLFLIVLLPLLLVSCKKDPEPQPVELRSYVSILSLLREPFPAGWVVDGIQVPDEQPYGSRILGAVILEENFEEISFTATNFESGSQIESLLLSMDKDKHYLIILYGSADEPSLIYQEVESARPQPDRVNFQILHAATTADSVDVYMGGTDPDNRVVTDLSYTEFSGYFEVNDYEARASVTLAIHGDVYDPEKELLNYAYNDLIVSNINYLSVLGYAVGDPLDTELKLWLYDLPTN
jgi:hypothetical protein